MGKRQNYSRRCRHMYTCSRDSKGLSYLPKCSQKFTRFQCHICSVCSTHAPDPDGDTSNTGHEMSWGMVQRTVVTVDKRIKTAGSDGGDNGGFNVVLKVQVLIEVPAVTLMAAPHSTIPILLPVLRLAVFMLLTFFQLYFLRHVLMILEDIHSCSWSHETNKHPFYLLYETWSGHQTYQPK